MHYPGNREGFAITMGEVREEPVVTDGVVENPWSSSVARHLEPLGTTSTTFYFKINRNMGSQDYSDPQITISDDAALKVPPPLRHPQSFRSNQI